MSAVDPNAPPPVTELALYRILSPNAGIRVSPFAIGGASIGQAWSGILRGGFDQDRLNKFMDEYAAMGGNFIDTANNYQHGESERLIGEWMKSRGNRDQMVVATKYSMNFKRFDDSAPIKVNFGGNARKSLNLSVQDSLKRLQTEYIDILFLHFWDYATSVAEVMQSLDALVKKGTVLYLGVSDVPAWIVQKCNDYARQHALTPFSVYTGMWSPLERDLEREIVPMCYSEGMAIMPWGCMGCGRLKSSAEFAERAKPNGEGLRIGVYDGSTEPNESELKMSAALEKVANEIGNGATVGAVCLAWIRAKVPNVYPIIGSIRIEQMKSNVEGLKVKLTRKQVEYIDQVLPFKLGFPHDIFGIDPATTENGFPTNPFMSQVSNHKYVKRPEPAL